MGYFDDLSNDEILKLSGVDPLVRTKPGAAPPTAVPEPAPLDVAPVSAPAMAPPKASKYFGGMSNEDILKAAGIAPPPDEATKQAALFAAAFGNPSEEAQKRKLSADITRIVGAHEPVLDVKEGMRRYQQLEADHATRASPRTSAFLSVPENAAVAIQDAKTMAQIEAIIGGDPLRSAEIAAKRFAMSTGALGAKVGFDFPAVATDIVGETLRAGGLPDDYNIFKTMSASARRQAVATRSAIEYFTPEARNIVERAAASAGESAGMSLQLLPLATATPQGAGMAAAFGLTTFAESYTKAREAKKTPLEALKYAIPQGAFEGLFEMAPAAFLADAIKNAPGLKQFTLGLLGKEIPTEMATTVSQNLNDWVTFNPGKSAADFIAEQPEALAETAIATIMGASIQAGLIHGAQRATGQFQQMQEERRTKQLQETLTSLFEEAKGIKSDPVTFQSFMAGATDNASVFINADALQETLAQSKIDPAVIPSLAEQLAQPSVTGDVEIPIGELMTAFSGTPGQEQIVQHARIRQDDLSAAEQAQFGDMAAFFKKQGAAVAERQKDNEQFVSERQEIEASIVEQLGQASPFGQREHRYYAQMMGAFYSTAAELMGTTPKQIQARWAPNILGATDTAQPTSTLSQGFDHGNAMLNVGLDVGATDRAQKIDADFVKAEIEKLGVQVLSAKEVQGEYEYEGEMVQELTYVPQLSRPLTEEEVNQLAIATGQEAIGQYDNGTGNLWGPNAANWGAFNPEFFKDQVGTKLSDAQKELAQSQSARTPTSKKGEDSLGPNPLLIDYKKIEDDKNAQNMALAGKYPGVRFKARGTDKRVEEFVQHLTDNLLWLHDQIPAEIRQRSKLWYDGANVIANRWAEKYDISLAQAAAVLAVYSPQKDWFTNVSLAERTLDIVREHQSTPWSDEMAAWFGAKDTATRKAFDKLRKNIEGKALSEISGKAARNAWVSAYKAAHDKELPTAKAKWDSGMSLALDAKKEIEYNKYPKLRALIEGKTLSELPDNYAKAVWLRARDEAHNDRRFRTVTPEGGFTTFVTAGEAAMLEQEAEDTEAESETGAVAAWGSYATIEKALDVLEDGSPAIISGAIGKKHKVRSFYNNIFDPASTLGFVTIDTHAVAAGLLRPLSGNDLEVSQNFGSAGSAKSAATGMEGTYAYYQEAYRRAAEARGLLPREMQSITWEAVRELYTMPFKHKKSNGKKVDELWTEYSKGKRDAESVRSEILKLAGGVEKPAWVGHDSGLHEGGWASSYTGELLVAGMAGRQGAAATRAGTGAAGGNSELAQRADAAQRAAGAVAGPVVGIHYSKAPRTSLASSMSGQGMKGAEAERIAASKDPRIKQRVNFYVNTGNGITPESDVGSNPHVATLRNLYDADADALKIWRNSKGDMNVAESAVLDAGFDGHLTRNFGKQGAVVMLGNRSLDVEGISREDVATRAEQPPSPEIPKMKQAAMAIMQNRALPNGQQSVASWKRDLERVDPDTAALIAWDKIPAGDYYKDQIAGQLWQTTWFYSALQRAIEGAPAKVFSTGKATAQWLSANAGKMAVKKEELEATGITDWLETQGKITKEQVVEFLKAGGVKVEEVVLGKGQGGSVEIVNDSWYAISPSGSVLKGGLETRAEAEAVLREAVNTGKFSDYQLPGGENYREWLLTLPSATAEYAYNVYGAFPSGPFKTQEAAQGYVDRLTTLGANEPGIIDSIKKFPFRVEKVQTEASRKTQFHSSHFDQPNIVAHIRTNERTDANGKRVLFIEEIQSDWAQKGRKEGFGVKRPAAVTTLPDGWSWKLNGSDMTLYEEGAYKGSTRVDVGDMSAAALEAAAVKTYNRHVADLATKGVPSAPFITDTKSWTALALKRMIAYAVEQGFDAIAWTTGEQQAARYDLSKQVSRVDYSKDGEAYRVDVRDLNGKSIWASSNTTPSELEDVIGKDITQKIVDSAGPNMRSLDQLDLKVGGEGMKGYYDGIVPQVANDVLKKLGGGKVGAVELQTGGAAQVLLGESDQQPGFQITPAMREAVGQGLPLFAEAAGPRRGSFNPLTFDLRLLADANRSTFIHEASHFFMAAYIDMASQPDAPPALKQYVEDLLGYLFKNVPGGEQVGGEGLGQKVGAGETALEEIDLPTVYHGTQDPEGLLREGFRAKPAIDLFNPPEFAWRGMRSRAFTDGGGVNWYGPTWAWWRSLTKDARKRFEEEVGEKIKSADDLGRHVSLLFTTKSKYEATAYAKVDRDAKGYEVRQHDPIALNAEKIPGILGYYQPDINDRGESVLVLRAGGSVDLRGAVTSDVSEYLAQNGGPSQPGPIPEGRTNIERWNAMTLDQQRAYWEFFAEGFEQYAMSGKAPTKALQSAFSAFAKWMKEIYKTLKAFVMQHGTKPLDAELTQYFDRMLATDEELDAARAERGFQALFKNLAESGMSPGQFADYMALDELQKTEANELLMSRRIRDMKWLSGAQSRAIAEIQAEADELRNLVRASVEEELANTPIRRVERWLKKGEMKVGDDEIAAQAGHRLNMEIVKAMFPEGAIAGQIDFAKLGRGKNALAASTGTMHPDTMAEIANDQFGGEFRNGEDLVRQLIEMPSFKDEVSQLTDLQMLEEHGDLATPEAIAKAADVAIHNDAHLKMLATELWALTNRTGSVAALTKAAKAFAQNLVDGTVVKKLRPVQFVNAATRAGKAVIRAHAKGELDKAATEKRTEVVNAAAAKAAYAAEAEVRAIMNRLRKISAYSDKHSSVTSREFSVVQAVRAILSEFEIGSKGEKAAKYLELVQEYDPTLGAVLDGTIKQLAPVAKPWDQLKVAELRELREAVDGLWRAAKEVRTVELNGERMDLDAARARLLAQIEKIPAKVRKSKAFSLTKAEQRNQKFMSTVAKGIRPETLFAMMDGTDEYGEFTQLIWNTINDAQLTLNTEKEARLKQLKALLTPIMADMTDIKIDAKDLGGTFGEGHVIGYSELLHAILHSGNLSNLERLLVGRGWGSVREDGTLDTTRWDAFMKTMFAEGKITKKHMDFVQATWDLLEELKPAAQAAHRATTGRFFPEIEAKEIVTPFGVYRGGYAPAIADRGLAPAVDMQAMLNDAQQDVMQTFEKPWAGFAKERTTTAAGGRPLELNIAALGRHIDSVLVFSHMSVPIRNVQRVLKGDALSKAISAYSPEATANIIAPWLHSAAVQSVTEKGKHSAENMAVWTKLRSRAGMAVMFANISNSIQQLTGFFPALALINKKEMLFAAAKGWYQPRALATSVAEMSPYMAQRLDNEAQALADEIDQILLNPTKMETAQAWANRHAYFLQMSVDMAMSPIIWQARFNQTMAEGTATTPEEVAALQAKAVHMADSAVRMTQGSNRAIDVAAIEKGSPLYRLFLQFAGWANSQANLLGMKLAREKLMPNTPAKYGRITSYLALIWWAPAIASMIVAVGMRGGPDDDDGDGLWDDWLTELLIAPVKMATSAIPFVGPALMTAFNAFNDKPYDDKMSVSPVISLVEGGFRGTAAAAGAIEDPTKTGRAIRDLGSFFSLFTGVPITPATKAIGYATDVETGKVSPTGPVDYGRGIITGVASPESKAR